MSAKKSAVEIESKWNLVTLENVAKQLFAGGDAPKTNFSKIETDKLKIPVYANGVENKGLYGFTDTPIVNEPCITISARGTLGYTEVRKEPFVPIVRLIVLIPNSLIDVNYLKLAITKVDFTDSGSVIPQLTIPKIKSIKIPLPPTDIQEKIVAECEAVDREVEKSERIIGELKNDITNTLITINKNSEIKKLGEICNMKAGNFVSASDINDNYNEELYPCYGGNGLRGYTKTFTHEGTFSLIGRQGALCGNVHKVTGKFHATEHAIVVTPFSDIDMNWLYYQFRLLNLNQYKTGTAQPGLSVQNLQAVSTPVPDLSQQQEIVAEIEKLENKIAAAQKIINESAAKKQAILNNYL